ncbi:MAG: MoxR family ATPase [Acidobacteriota bacterium]
MTRQSFVPLTGQGMVGRLGKPYEPSEPLVEAVNVALACGMPLLLTGEPGCGKTDLAWAVASVLDHDRDDDRDRRLLECHVRSDTRARDLLYHYDAVRRFGDGQLSDPEAQGRALNPANYVTLQALGLALVSPTRRVVLIDEIDKAQRDLPNDLLRALDEGKFEIPELVGQPSDEAGGIEAAELAPTMAAPPGAEPSLIIITSNVERQLPEPFLRRCVFYHIEFPNEDRLKAILAAHFGDVDGNVRDQALKVFLHLRREPGLTKKPATAELLTWMMALTTVFARQRVEDSLAAFARWVDRRASDPKRSWAQLPGLSTLLKLREDLETAGASGESQPVGG